MTAHYDPERDQEARSLVSDLRTVLGTHGIKLPSLGRDYGDPTLITLGNCNLATAKALVDALRQA
ncbi:hypothetical protein RND61_19685 [Streptomyces sp. TRM76323]|uniref:Uncharacterized protein n=1 Tax=Streptomyces tamarix TaxID=3078565 RepID=A0ABU3QNC6_9ACTN|nr:hypothetical protein [Streptomyces tamarix]MDT9684265.1 hypothetical protein [Streptomyces tamarix]